MNKVRKINIGFRIICIVLLGICAGYSVSAQHEYDIDGEVPDSEIVIEKERKIELSKELKLYEFIKWSPERKMPVLKPSEFKWYIYDVANEPLQFEPAKATIKSEDNSYQHYGKAGFGNYASPILDVSLTTAMDADMMVGLNVKHESFGSGAVDNSNSGAAASEANLYGAMIRDVIKLESAMNYRLEKNYYYGYPAGTSVDKSDVKHSGNFFNFDLIATDNNTEDVVAYKAGIGFNHYSDNFSAVENTLCVNIRGDFDNKIFVEADVNLSKYRDTGFDESRSYFRFNPYYRLMIDQLTLDVGLSLSLQNDDLPELSSSKIFPYAKASYLLTDGYSIFATLDGGYAFNTLYDFASEVGVLNQSVGIANSEKLFDFSGGITGNPTDQLSLKASVGFKSVRYLPVLVNHITDQSRMDMTYHSEKSNILTFKGEAQYNVSDQHQLSAGLNFYSYSSKGYDQIYHRPTSEILVSGDHQIVPKLNAKWNFTIMSGIEGQDLNLTDSDVKLDAITKLDLSLHYQLKEQWGFFLSGENLINKNYSRYLYYPQRGIQIKAGLTFRI